MGLGRIERVFLYSPFNKKGEYMLNTLTTKRNDRTKTLSIRSSAKD